MIFSRILQQDDEDATAMLNEMHKVAVDNFRAWWACDNPPYPSRSEMDAMLESEDNKFCVIIDYISNAVFGWYYFGPIGEIKAGVTRHDPSHDGYRADLDQSAIDIMTTTKEAIIAERGTVYHMAVTNPRVWYGLEVQAGIPLYPPFYRYGEPPTEPPPLPPEAVR